MIYYIATCDFLTPFSNILRTFKFNDLIYKIHVYSTIFPSQGFLIRSATHWPLTEQTKYLRAYNCAILWEYYFFFWWPLVLTNQKMRINKKNYSNLAAPMNKLFINFSIIEFGKRWITRTTTIVISQLLSRSQIDLTMTQHNIDQCTIKTSFLK